MKQPQEGVANGPHRSGNGDRYFYVRSGGSWVAVWRSQYTSETEWTTAVRNKILEAKRAAAAQ